MPQWVSPHFTENGYYSTAAVASDHVRCSEFGRDVMIEGGNAVEAAITVLICLGVVNPMSSGLGGGHFITLFNATSHKCSVVDAREVAPLAAFEKMYDNDPTGSEEGWRAMGVPGELHGLRTAYENFGGNIPWSRLFEPTIHMMKSGVPVSQGLEAALEVEIKDVFKESSLHDFINPETGSVWRYGDIMRNRVALRKTLETLAEAKDPVKEFYDGKISKQFLKEFKRNGGFLTAQDFKNYKSIVRNHDEIIVTELGDRYICGPPPPSSSAITQSIIKILDSFAPDVNQSTVRANVDNLHRFLETSKFAYATRGLLGDPTFANNSVNIARYITSDEFLGNVRSKIRNFVYQTRDYEPKFAPAPDHGTSNFAVLDAQGNAVVATTTINFLFGAGVASPSTGIIWNSNMDDFSAPKKPNFYGYPPSPANFIRPGKRPLSSVSPLIIINKNDHKVELAIGAAGGSRIISTVSFIANKILTLGWDLKTAINTPRLHNQLFPNVTLYEARFPYPYLKRLTDRGHSLQKEAALSEATAIHIQGKKLHAAGDYRQGAESLPAGY